MNMSSSKAAQACGSCKKQKRKCDKALPSCSLCARIGRVCDYVEGAPGPTAEDLAAMRMKLLELENRLNNTSGSGSGVASMQETPPPRFAAVEPLWQQASSQFPPDVFLDIEHFKWLKQTVPRPYIDIPGEVLEHLGDGNAVQQAIGDYFTMIHPWLPIVSKKRMHLGMTLFEGGPDLAMLFLSIKLITSKPIEGIASADYYVYTAAKRFLSVLEYSGFASIMLLQSMILVAVYEYSHAIYPAAWMTVGACVRYVDFLGLPDLQESNTLLSSCTTWTELEERRRAWWAVMVLDRIICLGNKKKHLFPDPPDNEVLPVDDQAWDDGRMGRAVQHSVSIPFSEPQPAFARLCEASIIAGRALDHCRRATVARKTSSPTDFLAVAAITQALIDATNTMEGDIALSPGNTSLLAPLCIIHSATIMVHDVYCCPAGLHEPNEQPKTQADIEVQVASVEALRRTAGRVRDVCERVLGWALQEEELGAVSPLMLDAMYSAASTLHWLLKEEGSPEMAEGLDLVKRALARLSLRWPLAGEYLKMLEQVDIYMLLQLKGQ